MYRRGDRRHKTWRSEGAGVVWKMAGGVIDYFHSCSVSEVRRISREEQPQIFRLRLAEKRPNSAQDDSAIYVVNFRDIILGGSRVHYVQLHGLKFFAFIVRRVERGGSIEICGATACDSDVWE